MISSLPSNILSFEPTVPPTNIHSILTSILPPNLSSLSFSLSTNQSSCFSWKSPFTLPTSVPSVLVTNFPIFFSSEFHLLHLIQHYLSSLQNSQAYFYQNLQLLHQLQFRQFTPQTNQVAYFIYSLLHQFFPQLEPNLFNFHLIHEQNKKQIKSISLPKNVFTSSLTVSYDNPYEKQTITLTKKKLTVWIMSENYCLNTVWTLHISS